MAAESNAGATAIDQGLASRIHARMESLRQSPVNPRFAHFSGSYLFDVEGVGSWKVAFESGRKTVTAPAPGAEADADCVIHSDPGVFLEVAEGERNLLTAFMQGRLDVEGDMALAQKLNSIMPASKKAAGGRGGAA